MNKKSVIWLVFFGILIVGLSSLLVYRLFFFEKLHNATKVVKVVDRISDYDYKLEDRDSKLYKTYFNELKELLSKNNVDEEKYADLLTKLFIIDFYTLDNKNNKYDVGGQEFVRESDIESFKNFAMSSYYKNVKDNTYGNRKQNLPTVTSVNIINIEDTVYNKKEEGYLIDVSWKYDGNYDASNHVNITLVKEDKKLVIAKVETIEKDV